MKTLFLVCCCTLFYVSVVRAQSAQAEVDRIRDFAAQIKKDLPKYDTTEIDLWESTEGGVATGYYNKGQIICIVAIYYGEMGKATTTYYFENEKLIQANHTGESYNRPIYYDKKRAAEDNDKEVFDPSKSVIETTSYFFQNEKLILLLDKDNKEVAAAVASNSIAGAYVLDDAHKLQLRLAKK